MSGISSVLCGKYRDYAEDADFRDLCGPASQHLVRCHVHVNIGTCMKENNNLL